MKLAEALILRADLQKRIEQIKARLIRNAKVQEGEKPGEKPQELIKEFENNSSELKNIIQKINRTNTDTELKNKYSLSDALAERDIIKIKFNMYNELAKAASITQDRYTKSEVKFKSTISITTIQKKADQLAKKHRELDTKIQEKNWIIELKE